MEQVTILGAGISGLSASFHIGHERSQVYEAKPHYGGHIFSFVRDGFTWDDGPHVLFTDSEYVKQVFAEGRKIRDADRKQAQARNGKKRQA